MNQNQKLTRIGVFYDGNYFYHVSNFYNYSHERKSRISIKGLHDFIRHKVSEAEGESSSYKYCQIVDAHYFRGRLNAREAQEMGDLLYYDRIFDDILMSEGVTTHYTPVRAINGKREEKGIDVWLALEAYEMAFYKHFDILVLIACDGDFVPLVRKLNTLGTRVMLLSWDFAYTDQNNHEKTTRTSQELLEEVTYPIAMHEIIDNRVSQEKFMINNLFLTKQERSDQIKSARMQSPKVNEVKQPKDSKYQYGDILSLKAGFGFIKKYPNNIYFHYTGLNNVDFNELVEGDRLKYQTKKNENNQEVAFDIYLISD